MSLEVNNSLLTSLIGKHIKDASSSLSLFTIELDDNTGLLIAASFDDEEPNLSISITPSNLLPKSQDAVCSVDWNWITGSKIINAHLHSERLKLQLDPVGPLLISAGTWQKSPFLSFQPYCKPK